MEVCVISADSTALTGQTTILFLASLHSVLKSLEEEPYFIIGKLDP